MQKLKTEAKKLAEICAYTRNIFSPLISVRSEKSLSCKKNILFKDIGNSPWKIYRCFPENKT